MTPVQSLKVAAYTVPTDFPEADGTLAWNSTTMVLVEVAAGGKTGLGYTYAHGACATLIHDLFKNLIEKSDALAVTKNWSAMIHSARNLGRPGITSSAVAAVDTALWDLKAKLLELPLATLLGSVRDRVEVYGSGGFTTYPPERLREQLLQWKSQGIKKMKMKIGTDPKGDLGRVEQACEVLAGEADLFVDANGAYSRKQALYFAQAFAELGVTWFEEPVVSDDLEGLRLLRDRAPGGMDITAGEYGYDLGYFRRMLEAGAVDVLQADATRCAGITEFLKVGALCEAANVKLSAHTAPALHLHPCCALAPLCHIEYFYDHARIEKMFFDGVVTPIAGALAPDLSVPGIGLVFKRGDAERYQV